MSVCSEHRIVCAGCRATGPATGPALGSATGSPTGRATGRAQVSSLLTPGASLTPDPPNACV